MNPRSFIFPAAALVVALVLAALSPLASSSPDGLEHATKVHDVEAHIDSS
ncbi:PDGLE domain-containing protein, partial [Klebsiella pneumoniae]